MWKKFSNSDSWYKKVTSGFITLTFIIKPTENFLLYVDGLTDNQVELLSWNIEDAKIVADQHIKHALKWV